MPESVKTTTGTMVAFGDVVQLSKERSKDPEADGFERYIGLEHLEPSDLKVRSWGDITDGTSFTTVFRPGQVLFGKRRVYLRKVAITEFSGVCSADIYALEPKSDQLLPELLPFILQSEDFITYGISMSQGGLSPRVNWKALAKFKFFLPSLDRQLKLVECLAACESTLDSLIASHRSLKNVLSSLSDALLRPTSPQDSVSISSFAKIDIDKCEIDQTATYKTAGVLNSGEGLFSKDDFVGASTKYKQMIRLHANQIVMRKLTAWEGAIAVVPQEFSRAVVSTEFPTLTLDESIAAPAYLKWVFRQPWFWHEMKARSKGTALRRSRLNPKDLITIAVSLPCMERQSEIIGSLEDLESQQGAIQRRRQNLLALKEAILKGVFSEDPENPVGTTEGNTE